MYEFLGMDSENLLEFMKRENHNTFQMHKIRWLETNKEYSNATKRTYWVLMNRNVCPIEKKKHKDLYEFTNEEIEDILKKSNSIKTMTTLKSVILNYINWAVEKGYKIKQNPDGTLDKSKYFKTFQAEPAIKYKTLDEFYEMIEKMKCSDIDKILLLLARYGVLGKGGEDIINLKWQDIDLENMIIHIGNNIKLPIDDRFLLYLERAKKCESYEYKTSTLKYIDYGYVLKVSDKSDNNTTNVNTLYTRGKAIFNNNGMDRIPFSYLVDWRMFDLLFDILKEKDEITYEDIKKVITTIKGKSTISQEQYLKERFTILSEYRRHLESDI